MFNTRSNLLPTVGETKTIYNRQNRNCKFLGVFFDYSKAFDTINHEISISELEHYGIRGIAKDWFYSYVANRKQFEIVNGCKSDLRQ